MSGAPVEITLVDVNPRMVAAWRVTFASHPEVKIVSGSMLAQEVDAWVTPTNSKGFMDGGLDGVIKRHLGPPIEKAVQAQIKALAFRTGTRTDADPSVVRIARGHPERVGAVVD